MRTPSVWTRALDDTARITVVMSDTAHASSHTSEPLLEAQTCRIKAIALLWMEDGWQKGCPDVVDRLHGADFVDHHPAGRSTDNEGFKDGIQQLYRAFPDFFAVTDDLVIDSKASTVAVRWHATGSHLGDFMGIPASKKIISFSGIEIIRIENEKIVERWGEWNGEAILRQLGVTA
jgi:steroid delta-isomerase-like uncharacterized protein